MKYKIIEILLPAGRQGLTFFLAFLTWLLRQQIKRIDQLEKDSNSIRFNYLDRFTEMSKKLEAIHIDIAVIKTSYPLKIKFNILQKKRLIICPLYLTFEMKFAFDDFPH